MRVAIKPQTVPHFTAPVNAKVELGSLACGGTLQIFWLQKLQLLVESAVQLKSGCDFCKYQLKQILVANIATES